MPVPDSIAIVGIGCRLPGNIESAEQFWDLLKEGKEAITEIPKERWQLDSHFNDDPKKPLNQHVRRGGFIKGIDQFDPSFFGITPREAICMDPQQRLLMEVAWRSIEDAGHPVESLRGKPVGVFIGISSADYSSLLWTSNEDYLTPDNEPFILPGNTGCIAANRLSYFLDLKGPSFTVDTACSSSLVAVHLACESLWRGESELAFAGGVQALIHPGIQMSFCKAGLLSPEGRCKSFDADANGYVRSEGAGVILLKPLSTALRDGDTIHALIRGTAVNSDGRSQGLAAPSQRSQMACVKAAFAKAGIDPKQTQYVEAHGTGTRQGDPIELRALGSVLGAGRHEANPCRVGSVKTNLGHGETAAGITGLIKTVLCLRERKLPPSLNFQTPNSSIDFLGLGLKVQTTLEEFPNPKSQLIAGVSSFGFGGTNAHVVLSEAQQASTSKKKKIPTGKEPPLNLLFLSARTPSALETLIENYLEFIDRSPKLNLNNLCASSNLGRSVFAHSFIAVFADLEELISQLKGDSLSIWRGEASLTAMGSHPLDQCLASIQLGISGIEGKKQLEELALAIGKGHKIDWHHFHCSYPHQRICLPGHPFIKQRYWWSQLSEGNSKASLWLDHLGKTKEKLISPDEGNLLTLKPLNLPGKLEHFELALEGINSSDLVDHSIRDWIVFPAAGYLALALDLQFKRGKSLTLLNFNLESPLLIEKTSSPIQAVLENDQLNFHSFDSSKNAWNQLGQVQLTDSISGKESLPTNPPANEISSLSPKAFYEKLQVIGLNYGKRYQPIVELSAAESQSWVKIERPNGAPDRCLLDGCFQAVAACLDSINSKGQLFLPVGLERIHFSQWPLPDNLNCYSRLRAVEDASTLVADITVEANETIIGEINGLQLRRLTRSVIDLLFPAKEIKPFSASLYANEWIPIKTDSLKDVLPLGRQISLITEKETNSKGFTEWIESKDLTIAPLNGKLQGEPIPNPLIIWPSLSGQEPLDAVKFLLTKLQDLSDKNISHLWLVLEGESPTSNALAAFFRTVSLEKVDWNCTTLHLPKESEPQPNSNEWNQIWLAANDQSELLWENNQIKVPQLAVLDNDRFKISSDGTGRLEGLHKQAISHTNLLPGEIEISVEATGLNFRDVLNALGLLNEHAASLGLHDSTQLPIGGEAVGRVVALGPRVDKDLLGKRVIAALTVGSLSSHVVARAELCIPLPDKMTIEEGASCSTAFLTAIYGLEELAKLKCNETVLIHAAAGGVGQAALQVAKNQGARVIATASKAKHAGLLEQGVEAVFDSRTTSFADDVLAHTNGKGVDVVLNSLKGDWVDASFKSLAQGGRFIELGKIDIWSKKEAAERRPDCLYLPFDLLEVSAIKTEEIRILFSNLIESLSNGSLQHIPIQTWPIERAHEAFRHMAQARHIGKVVITQPSKKEPLSIRPNGTYVVTGALGGIGLKLIEWLRKQGARSLILISRKIDSPSTEAAKVLDRLRKEGINYIPIAFDLSTTEDIATESQEPLLKAIKDLPSNFPLKGVFHAAGILQDNMISNINEDSLKTVINPKLNGWKRMETLLAKTQNLDFLIGFSSVASLLGSPGQSSYAAANGAMEAFCKGQDQQPIRLAIQWGPWQGKGMAQGLERRFERVGIGMLESQDAFNALSRLLERGQGGVVAVLNNDWSKLASQALNRQRSWFAGLLENIGPSPVEQLKEKLQRLPESEREFALMVSLRERLARVMAAETEEDSLDPSSIDSSDSLFNLGLDSLMAVEYAAVVQTELGVRLDLEALSDDPSLDGLAAIAIKQIMPTDGETTYQGLDLASEAQLDDNWQHLSSKSKASPGESILLTGASGFLGAYLLAGQLECNPNLSIRCLLRASSKEHGLERIQSNLSRYNLWNSSWSSRIEPILGDLSQPSFGLHAEEFQKLTEGLGGILHNGAQLSQMASYAQLASANVGGTKEVLRLATLSEPIRVELVSSVSVFEAAAYRNQVIKEDDDLSHWEGIHIGYSQTKWVSERLVIAAGKAGLPITVYRPPLIGGHSKTGHWHQGDLLQRLLQGCLALGQAPQLAWELDLVPVDYVADAINSLAWRDDTAGNCFHLQHPRPLMLNDLLNLLITSGAPLKQVPMEEWLEAIATNPGNPLYPLRTFFNHRWGTEQLTYPELNALGVRSRPSCSFTTEKLAELAVQCPDFEDLISPWAGSLLSNSVAA